MTTHTIQPDPMTVEIEREEAFTWYRFLRVTVSRQTGHCAAYFTLDASEVVPETKYLSPNERAQLEALIAQEWEAWK